VERKEDNAAHPRGDLHNAVDPLFRGFTNEVRPGPGGRRSGSAWLIDRGGYAASAMAAKVRWNGNGRQSGAVLPAVHDHQENGHENDRNLAHRDLVFLCARCSGGLVDDSAAYLNGMVGESFVVAAQ
jgi:hypothetical protein